ncbi:MAG: nitroreductase family protein [Bacteroidales bacterium]|nr:nitroreductase family protein [Bacteroidales bacterium]
MEKLSYILDRRSIRIFKDQKIDSETIKKLLTAAMYAPSAVDRQPWHFVVIDQPQLMEKIMKIHPHARMLQTASHAIVVCGDEQLQHDDGYWVVDCGAATQNLLLATHTLGLGACWVGLHPREERKSSFSRLLVLPSHVKPFALVALGYPDESKSRPERFHAEKVRYNGWESPFFST